MIFPAIPRPDNRETSLAARPLVTNYNLPAMEETYFLSEREGEETSKAKEGKAKPPPVASLNVLEQNPQESSQAAVQSGPLPSVHLGLCETLLRSGIFSR